MERSEAELRFQIARMADRLSALEMRWPADCDDRPVDLNDDKLATIAASISQARRRRGKLFDPSLFSEPAWDMLLDLFVSKVRGRRVSTTSLCLAASVTPPTGIRWIDTLEKHGLVRRVRVPDDGRLTLVEISDHAFGLMRKYVSEGVSRFEMPLPDSSDAKG